MGTLEFVYYDLTQQATKHHSHLFAHPSHPNWKWERIGDKIEPVDQDRNYLLRKNRKMKTKI